MACASVVLERIICACWEGMHPERGLRVRCETAFRDFLRKSFEQEPMQKLTESKAPRVAMLIPRMWADLLLLHNPVACSELADLIGIVGDPVREVQVSAFLDAMALYDTGHCI